MADTDEHPAPLYSPTFCEKVSAVDYWRCRRDTGHDGMCKSISGYEFLGVICHSPEERLLTLKAMTLRELFTAGGAVRIKLDANFPSDDFNRPWQELAPELQNKWRALAKLVVLAFSREEQA